MTVTVSRTTYVYTLIVLLFCFMPSLLRVSGSISASFLVVFTIPVFLSIILSSSRAIRDRVSKVVYRSRYIYILSSILVFLHVISIMFVGGGVFGARSLVSLINFIFLYSLFVLALSYSDNRSGLVKVFVFATLASCFIAILQKFGFRLGGGYYAGDDRYSAFYAHPNQLGVVLACASFVLVDFFLKGHISKRRYLVLPAYLAVVIGLILSGSKSSILILAMVMALYFMMDIFRRPVGIFLFLFLSVSLVVLFSSIFEFLVMLNPRLFSVLTENSIYELMEYRTIEDRIGLWLYSLEVAEGRPLLGEGVSQTIFGYFTHSHNLVFDYLRIFGYPGLLVIIFTVYSIYFSFKGGAGESLAFWGVLTYFLVNMLSDSMGPQTVFVLAFLLGLCGSSRRLNDMSGEGTFEYQAS